MRNKREKKDQRKWEKERKKKREGIMRKCEKKLPSLLLQEWPTRTSSLWLPFLCRQRQRRTYARYHSFCQGALSGFHLATLLLFMIISPKISHPSSPILHQPRVGRTTFFLPKPPFRVFGLSKDFLAFFSILLGFSLFFYLFIYLNMNYNAEF